ncbi:MAG: SSU ribosomal protein S14p (S29e) @ SSU ribosomal protein S14p (S29e), zinc-dependent, partial [uncultured Chloroflexi bacterium]
GKEVQDREVEAPPEVRGAVPQPLPPLWPAARLPAQVRAVPHLLPGTGPAGPDPRCDQSELV